jgi:hypothetical protein
MKGRIQGAWHNLHDTTMLFAFVLWLCVLPLILWLVVPWLGWQIAVFGAGVAFVLALIACYALCAFPEIVRDHNKGSRG